MPHGITQCYLPPDRADIPVLTPAEAGTRFSDPGGMQGWVDLWVIRPRMLWVSSNQSSRQVRERSRPWTRWWKVQFRDWVSSASPRGACRRRWTQSERVVLCRTASVLQSPSTDPKVITRYAMEQGSTSHLTQNRSFRRRSSQPISWLRADYINELNERTTQNQSDLN